MKDETSPAAVPGSVEVSHWLIRDSHAADAGAVGRIVRRLSWELVGITVVAFFVGLCGGCLGVIFVPFLLEPYRRVITAMWRRRAVKRGLQTRPAEPWNWGADVRAEGVDRPVERARRGRGRLLVGLALLAMAVLLGQALGQMGWIAVLLGAPAALFLWLGYRDVRAGRIALRWGSWPLVTGGRVELMLGVSDGGARFGRATVRLRAIEEHPARTHLVWCTWTDIRVIAPDAAPGPGNDVLLAFDVPEAARGTRLDVPEACWWELEITGSSDAGPMRERFVVPIYDRPPPEVPPPT